MTTKKKAPMAGIHQGNHRQVITGQLYQHHYTPQLTQDASTWRCCIHCMEMIPDTDYYYDTPHGPVCTGCVGALGNYTEADDEAI